jgi:Uma2 family endonuclease
MAVSTRRRASSPDAPAGAPRLRRGDRLSRAEFHRRYELHPEIRKAELIDGVVYIMASPLNTTYHGAPDFNVTGWLSVYRARTPGLAGSSNGTVLLDENTEVQPDVQLCLGAHLGGQTRITDEGYVAGAPELVVEVASSSADYDLHVKRRAYERNGVREYVVVLTREAHVVWLTLDGAAFRDLEPDSDGILRSLVFPGLWLDPVALLAGDMAAVLRMLEAGLASDEHKVFVEQLSTLH